MTREAEGRSTDSAKNVHAVSLQRTASTAQIGQHRPRETQYFQGAGTIKLYGLRMSNSKVRDEVPVDDSARGVIEMRRSRSDRVERVRVFLEQVAPVFDADGDANESWGDA